MYVVRHGTTDYNTQNKLRGWSDIPLNHQGIKEAVDLGSWFKDKPVSTIYSSDLKRALSTSDEIAKNTGAKILSLASLRPINFGSWNGKNLSDIGPKIKDLMDRWKDTPDVKAPGGESFSDFQNRNRTVFEEVLKNLKPEDHVVISGHLRTMNYIENYVKNNRQLLSGNKISSMNKEEDNPASVSTYDYNPLNNKIKAKQLDYTDQFGK